MSRARNRRAKPTPAQQERDREAREAQAKVRRVKATFQILAAADEEMRRHAALWIAAMRNRIAALANEVHNVLKAVEKPDGLLGRVMEQKSLRSVMTHLSVADNEAASMALIGDEMPATPLLLMEESVLRRMPEAAERARLCAEARQLPDPPAAKGGA